MDNTFKQKIIELAENHEDEILVQHVPVEILASIEYIPDFWYWLDFEKANKS